MTEKLKINFAPGCFDNFEGTQEELDALQAEIQSMFENMTAEDLEAQSRAICVDDLIEDESIDDDQFETILQALVGNNDRKLH
jgi:hypothetical protein